jgi:hypothetical protein
MASGVYIRLTKVENNESTAHILELLQGLDDSAEALYNRYL